MNVSAPRLAGGFALLAISAALLAACATPQVTDYAAEKPVLDLRQYFNGTIDANGVFTNRSGKVARRFSVVMTCSWQGPPGSETGTLDEDFTYSDGTKERRVWTLRRTGDGRYVGTAADVVGEANGQESGNAFRWNYMLKLPVDGKTIEVQFDDWMYLMNSKVLLNKAEMSKFGFRVGDVTLSFVKR
jgi:hypothetical protein